MELINDWLRWWEGDEIGSSSYTWTSFSISDVDPSDANARELIVHNIVLSGLYFYTLKLRQPLYQQIAPHVSECFLNSVWIEYSGGLLCWRLWTMGFYTTNELFWTDM
jgi:hypothetical protein